LRTCGHPSRRSRDCIALALRMTVVGRRDRWCRFDRPCYNLLMKKSRQTKRSSVGVQSQLADDLAEVLAEVAGSVKGLPPDLSERKKAYLKSTGYGLDRQAARKLRTRKAQSRD